LKIADTTVAAAAARSSCAKCVRCRRIGRHTGDRDGAPCTTGTACATDSAHACVEAAATTTAAAAAGSKKDD
jgi:hypothetical protein